MYKIGKSKMQVNMYRVVLILFLVVSWIQSTKSSDSNASTTKQDSSTSTIVSTTEKKSQSISSTKQETYPSAKTKHENSTTPNSNPDTTKTTLICTTNSITTVVTSTTPKSSTVIASTSTTNSTTTVVTSTTPKSSAVIASTGTTNSTNAVAISTTPKSSTVIASTGTTNSTTTVVTSPTPKSSTVNASTGTTNSTTTVVTSPTTKSSTVIASTGTTNSTSTVVTSPTPKSSTVIASTGTTNSTSTVATSKTHASNPNTASTTTVTMHKISSSTTGTANTGNPKLTTKTKTSSRTQSPGTTKTTTPATSTVRVTALGKIYISEVMMGRDDVLPQVELYVTAGDNISHYTLAVFDDTQNMVQSYQLNHSWLHDGFLTVYLNNTMLGSKTNSVGIALYDTSLWINKTLNNTAGLVDALVIGTSFQNTSARLIQILTPGSLPIVLQLHKTAENESITRCSEERACDSSMFIYTSPSFGKNNSAICENRLKNMDTITLKFNCSCQTCGYKTHINEIIHFLIQEIDKNCQCEVTALNIIDIYFACCGGTALHATIVAADVDQKDKMMAAYKTLLHSITTVTLGHNNYTINKECGSYCCHSTDGGKSSTDGGKSSTDAGKSPTYSAKSSTDSSKTEPKAEANIKLRVAVIVTCIMVFLVIVIIVVLYRRRKKRGVHQFSMIRLNEEDEDLIMDGVENDNVVGGQEATFYKKRLGF